MSFKIVSLMAACAAATFALQSPAAAAPVSAGLIAAQAAPAVENVQYYYYRRHRGYDAGAAAAAGVAGLAAGALIAGAIANQQPAAPVVIDDPEWEARCYRKYRSFDRHTGTYLGRDGVRRYCE